jgi:uncharacterized SAM-binding protein YcdF (DUF218 family)
MKRHCLSAVLRGDARPSSGRPVRTQDRPSAIRHIVRVTLIVAAGSGILVSALFATAPRWLPVQDSLQECTTVVVLNGDPPFRVEEAADIYRAIHAREIWLTADPASGDRRGDAGTRWNARGLVELGVPSAAIHVVPGAARGTRAELAAVAAELARLHRPCAVAVTSPLHTRRAKMTWRRDVGVSPQLIMRHPSGSNYVSRQQAGQELLGIARMLAGFSR